MERSDPASAVPSASPRWGLGDFAGGLAGSYVAVFALQPLVLAITDQSGVSDTKQWPLTTVALLQLPFYGVMAGVAIWAASRKGRGPVDDFGLQWEAADIPRGLTLGVVVQLSLFALYAPLFWLTSLDQHDLDKPARELADKATGAGVLLLVLIVVIAAPIVEEIFFRGLLLGALRRRWGTTIAVVGSAAVFALTHFELLQLPALFAFGLLAGALYVRTGRLGPSIVAHFAFNATAVLMLVR
jgi:membrane protease YdiL (CAAX protease family)